MYHNRQQSVTDFRSDYATRVDVCDALADDTNSLYLLAFLLTANNEAAERCFIAAVEQAFKPDAVFKVWVPSWIRRTLITCAITIVFDESNRAPSANSWYPGQRNTFLAVDAVSRLADLDRFVFVMSVLERYSVHECSLLLGCPPGAVIESRRRALRDLQTISSSLMSAMAGLSSHLAATA